METWMKELLENIEKNVGKEKIAHYQTVILPQILMDFNKQLNNAAKDQLISEEYRMEDGSLTIRLSGIKDNKGRCLVKKTKVLRYMEIINE